MSAAFQQNPPWPLGSCVQFEKDLPEDRGQQALCLQTKLRQVKGRHNQGQGALGCGSQTQTIPFITHSPGGTPRNLWERNAEWVKMSKAPFTGGVTQTQDLHQLPQEHSACYSSIIHSIKLLVPDMNPKLVCGRLA